MTEQPQRDQTGYLGAVVSGIATGACVVLVSTSSEVNSKVTFAALGGVFGAVFLGWLFALANGEGR